MKFDFFRINEFLKENINLPNFALSDKIQEEFMSFWDDPLFFENLRNAKEFSKLNLYNLAFSPFDVSGFLNPVSVFETNNKLVITLTEMDTKRSQYYRIILTFSCKLPSIFTIETVFHGEKEISRLKNLPKKNTYKNLTKLIHSIKTKEIDKQKLAKLLTNFWYTKQKETYQ